MQHSMALWADIQVRINRDSNRNSNPNSNKN